MGSEAKDQVEVIVVSDGTGDTATAAVKAVMLQFQSDWNLRVVGGVRQESEVRRVIERAAGSKALVVFSLVDKRVAACLIQEAGLKGVATVDLLGALIANVAQHLHAEPRHQPGLLHGFSDEYFQRIEAVEFAVRHDDGANLPTLFEADIVLTGVSRTSKTPLSMYLAQRGYRTGNVPLVAGLEPPQALLELDPRKVFALHVDHTTLIEVRRNRLVSLRASPHSSYTDPEAVSLEINRAKRLFRERSWRMVDISGRAVEENAARILELYKENPPTTSRG
ncbi:MAG: kinase/pyrophosphorylase [Deltaproteobacteria bacterium]|nr:kinase/pyrophosphorylase [Deltaproteobacteria bacterium]MBW2421619.1 kinase/pyrophosphorylase [Deltaproteobacteria bacterium]